MSEVKYSASAKFLLLGEYLVLRGAKALVIPLRFRQNLSVKSGITDDISWYSYQNDNLWFSANFNSDFSICKTTDNRKAETAQKLLLTIHEQNPQFKLTGKHLRFDIDFDRHFGLGTSSTLCSLLAQWSGTDPYLLQQQTFRGSGFDIAAATAGTPVIYQLQKEQNSVERFVKPASIHKNIADKLLFIYTGKKQNSLAEVVSFGEIQVSSSLIKKMNSLVDDAVRSSSIEEFEDLMEQSEKMLSLTLKKEPVKKRLFSDYPFSIKSLGAWGGDFVMASYRDQSAAIDYFRNKNLNPIFTYPEVAKI